MTVRVGTATASDGERLSYRVDGDGPTALLASNGIGVSTCFWRPLAAHFGKLREYSFITWDYRAHGNTPVPMHPEEMTISQCAGDLHAVLRAAGFSRAVLLGHSMGAQVILEAYRARPEAVQALVPALGAAGRVLPWVLKPLIAAAETQAGPLGNLLHRGVRLPGVWQAMRALRVVHPDLCPREAFEPYFDHLAELDLRGWFALARDMTIHDASALLPQVTVPTLVIAGERDLFAPLKRSQQMAAEIPGAELLVLREGSHAALVEQPELVALTLEKFLHSHHLS